MCKCDINTIPYSHIREMQEKCGLCKYAYTPDKRKYVFWLPDEIAKSPDLLYCIQCIYPYKNIDEWNKSDKEWVNIKYIADRCIEYEIKENLCENCYFRLDCERSKINERMLYEL